MVLFLFLVLAMAGAGAQTPATGDAEPAPYELTAGHVLEAEFDESEHEIGLPVLRGAVSVPQSLNLRPDSRPVEADLVEGQPDPD